MIADAFMIVGDLLLTQAFQVGVLFVPIACACLALRRASAHWRYVLWLVLLVKCLTPPVVTVPLTVLPDGSTLPAGETVLAGPTSERTAASAPRIVAPAPQSATYDPIPAMDHVSSDEPGNATSLAGQADAPAAGTDPVQTERGWATGQWLTLAWLVASGGFLLFALFRACRIHRRLRASRRPASTDLHSLAAKLATQLGSKAAIRLWMLDEPTQPFVWGLMRGAIYLPADFGQDASAGDHRAILMHEVAHVVRCDAAVNALQVLAQGIFLFHPLVWWTNRNIRREREKCCDEAAVAALGTDPNQYGAALVDVLAAKGRSARPAPSLAVAGPVKRIEERIRTIMKPNKTFHRKPTRTALLTALLLAALSLPTALVLRARAISVAPVPAQFQPFLGLWRGTAVDKEHEGRSSDPLTIELTVSDKGKLRTQAYGPFVKEGYQELTNVRVSIRHILFEVVHRTGARMLVMLEPSDSRLVGEAFPISSREDACEIVLEQVDPEPDKPDSRAAGRAIIDIEVEALIDGFSEFRLFPGGHVLAEHCLREAWSSRRKKGVNVGQWEEMDAEVEPGRQGSRPGRVGPVRDVHRQSTPFSV